MLMNMFKCIIYLSDQVNQPVINIGGIFTVKLVNTTGEIVSTATAHNVSPDHNRVNITCSNNINYILYPKISKSILVGEFIIIMYSLKIWTTLA